MGVARRRWSPDEKRTVLQLSKEGYTHKQIAERLRPGVATAWRSVGEIIREERKNTEPVSDTVTDPSSGSTNVAQHSVLPTKPSFTTTVDLPDGMSDSLTAREFMTMMDDDQRAIFVATYEDLRGDADEESLTRAENEMLIRASYSNVKYLRAQSLLNVAESYLILDMEGGLPDTDEGKAKRRFAGNREAYKKECEQWQKEYMEYLTGLKLTRKQRLDKIKDTRNTFLDLQQELTSKIRRESIIEDIKRINMATEDEFRRMARGETGPDGRTHPWLIGAFDEYLNSPITEQLEEKKMSEQQEEEFCDGCELKLFEMSRPAVLGGKLNMTPGNQDPLPAFPIQWHDAAGNLVCTFHSVQLKAGTDKDGDCILDSDDECVENYPCEATATIEMSFDDPGISWRENYHRKNCNGTPFNMGTGPNLVSPDGNPTTHHFFDITPIGGCGCTTDRQFLLYDNAGIKVLGVWFLIRLKCEKCEGEEEAPSDE